jgi:SAM-dependent methyltransferase
MNYRKFIPQKLKEIIKAELWKLQEQRIGEILRFQEQRIDEILSLHEQVIEEIQAFKENKSPDNIKHHVQATDTEILIQQLLSILQLEKHIPTSPPKHLQVRVVGDYSPNFISSGYGVYEVLNATLKKIGKELSDFNTILDFGCGCGRVLRAVKTRLPTSHLFGIDIDSEAIEWLKNNYSMFGRFSVTPHIPPTSYHANKFDLIYGISVFTHLPEDMQFLWLEELRRISKPKGYVILTTHGEKHYSNFPADIIDIMNVKGFYYAEPGYNYGKSISLPDFYQNAYHSHKYISNEWGKYFNILDIQALGLENHQDIMLLQK